MAVFEGVNIMGHIVLPIITPVFMILPFILVNSASLFEKHDLVKGTIYGVLMLLSLPLIGLTSKAYYSGKLSELENKAKKG